ncbi:MAG: hypothetical protein Q4C30_08405 [Bacteroidia bacterium]|nr:hypothetical protein [Bacteroidia bacterium]
MNKKILFVGAIAAALTACDYNDDNFDGLDELVHKTNVATVEYTYAAEDYPSSKGYFESQSEAVKNISSFISKNYYAYDNGSAVKVTYNTAKSLPVYLSDIENAKTITLKDADYKAIWEGQDVAEVSFVTPSSEKRIANVISTEGAKLGDYAVVTYYYSTTEPNISAPAEPETPTYPTIAEVIAAEDGEYTVQGTVAGIYKRGFLLQDATGYVLIYLNAATDRKLGDVVTVSGTTSKYSGFKQFKDCTVELVKSGAFSYPKPVTLTGAQLEADLNSIKYVTMSGKLTIDGNYVNVDFEEGVTRRGSISYPLDGVISADLNGQNVTLTGYYIGFSGKYLYFMLTSISAASNKAASIIAATEKKCAIYKFDGSAWKVATDAIVLSPADYTAMNQKYANFDNFDVVNAYLPVYVNRMFPYAEEEATKAVVYNYYSNKVTSLKADLFTVVNGSWVKTAKFDTKTSQFVKEDGVWSFNPNVTINLPADKSAKVAEFYQAMVDWTAANVKNGADYVTSYKNNDYYSGASAYQTNFDWRASKAKEQYADGYTGMSDDAIVAAMKEHTIEVLLGVLPQQYPDAEPIDGYEVFYTINFVVYDGASSNWTIKFKVTAKGAFEYVENSLSKVE